MNTSVSVIVSVDELPDGWSAREAEPLPPWRGVLMVSPEHFRVAYAINPHMRDADGGLQVVDPEKARAQWDALGRVYESIGYPVSVLGGLDGLPDMVFAANQSFPFPRDGGEGVLLSRMRHEQRAAEIPAFEDWFRGRGTFMVPRPDDAPYCEGAGDLLWVPGRRVLLGGYGFRTDREALDEVAAATGARVLALRLTDERFYHLDTCIAPLDGTRALWVPTAFDDSGTALLHRVFDRLIEVSEDEAANALACNAHCPDGRSVIIEAAAEGTRRALEAEGFRVFPVETSEFLKSGGSVFCMKQMLF
ncbi:MAG: arginine deiminase-related protein [Planctomycetota bacterium]|nr:arginine deiminase-related protein [Planctomycetota bacterium]